MNDAVRVPVALPPHITLVTPVWGAEYIRLFCDVVCRSLLAPDNLPAISQRFCCTYHIYTDDEANSHFHSSSFNRLRDLVDLRFHDLGSLTADNKYSTMGAAYNDAVNRASERQSGIIFLNADMIYSNGSFAHLSRLIDLGRRCIEIEGFRADKQAIENILTDRYEDLFTISSAPLVRLALKHIHPISACHLWEKGGGFMPFHTYWTVRTGLLARASHIYPLYLWPRSWNGLIAEKSIDWDLVDRAGLAEIEKYIVQDSQEIFSVELSDVNYWIPPAYPQGASIGVMRSFVAEHCGPENLQRLSRVIRLRTVPDDHLAWKWAEFKSWLWYKAVAENSDTCALVLNTIALKSSHVRKAISWAGQSIRAELASMAVRASAPIKRVAESGREIFRVIAYKYRIGGIPAVRKGIVNQLTLRVPFVRIVSGKYQREGTIGVMRGIGRQVRLRVQKRSN
ncbi:MULTISPECIES: hypothetical protein [unclassified Bradyrhizobium]|uniref:hypothetical protein n=1 Tax=unclassified Bradyrhizobium TaxID=2631580 RepID=UPI0029163491|nr:MULTISPECIES: hypothetical protein [unclassified Bradyrhizobium]